MARLDLHASFFGGRGFTLYHAWGRNSAMPLNPHFHDEYLISGQIRGVESCHVGGELETFAPGDVVLINPHQVHTGNTEAEEDLEYISLYVDRELVQKIADELGAPTGTPEFTVIKSAGASGLITKLETLLEIVSERDLGLLPPRHASHDPELSRPAARFEDLEAHAGASADAAIGDASAPGDPGDSVSLESALADVVVHAFEEFSNIRAPMLRSTRRIGHRKIARAVEFIESLPGGDGSASPTLEELAEVAGLSKYHFLRQFSQVVGMTPGAYMRTLRLCQAARKLRSTDMPILDIALSVGFADHPSFSRAFARHMGMTPSDYQKLGPL